MGGNAWSLKSNYLHRQKNESKGFLKHFLSRFATTDLQGMNITFIFNRILSYPNKNYCVFSHIILRVLSERRVLATSED